MSHSSKVDDQQMLSKLAKDFHDMLGNKETFRTSLENFLDNVIDELTLGIIFDLHRKYKTNCYDTDKSNEEDELGNNRGNFPNQDLDCIECACPICDRSVGASKFAQHLRTCMGLGRKKSTRRTVTTSNSRDRENTTFSGMPTSDDDDDLDWNSVNKRGKKKKRTNGNKKPKGGTPKKPETRSSDSTVDMEIDDELANLRDLLQDQTNSSSSPTDSMSSNQSNTSSRKKDKNKSKRSKRSSPSILSE